MQSLQESGAYPHFNSEWKIQILIGWPIGNCLTSHWLKVETEIFTPCVFPY